MKLNQEDLIFQKAREKLERLIAKDDAPRLQIPKTNGYNTRVMVGNWLEDRRYYRLMKPRCTGESITKTDFQVHCKLDYLPDQSDRILNQYRKYSDIGDDDNIKNTEIYCDYLKNYTTTYDLVHNWRLRNDTNKPRVFRKWRMLDHGQWEPQHDNAKPVGNLTQIGFRKAPALPIVPKDWNIYKNNSTTYLSAYPPPRYPDAYVFCRRAATKQISRENHDMIMQTTAACQSRQYGICVDENEGNCLDENEADDCCSPQDLPAEPGATVISPSGQCNRPKNKDSLRAFSRGKRKCVGTYLGRDIPIFQLKQEPGRQTVFAHNMTADPYPAHRRVPKIEHRAKINDIMHDQSEPFQYKTLKEQNKEKLQKENIEATKTLESQPITYKARRAKCCMDYLN